MSLHTSTTILSESRRKVQIYLREHKHACFVVGGSSNFNLAPGGRLADATSQGILRSQEARVNRELFIFLSNFLITFKLRWVGFVEKLGMLSNLYSMLFFVSQTQFHLHF